MKYRAYLIAAILGVLLVSGVALGKKTPDGRTPAEEGICDELIGGTPGLYGLCVAYCEAQDCALDTARSAQCAAPSPKILEIYRQKMEEGDPDMPCVQQGCPCWNDDELIRIFSDDIGQVGDDPGPGCSFHPLYDCYFDFTEPFPGGGGATYCKLAVGEEFELGPTLCQRCFNGADLSSCLILEINAEEEAICLAEFAQFTEEMGLTCFIND